MRKRLLTIVILSAVAVAFLSVGLRAQNVVTGTWKTIADEGKDKGKVDSHLEIFEQKGLFFARITKLLLDPQDKTCDKCKGDLKDKPVVGMVIMTNMKKTGNFDKDFGDEYAGGDIMDPNNGKSYRCKIWVKGDVMTVRGYVAFFYRTQNWFRVTE
ncbi:MAG: DUF2147 domain-containing protein [Candidatus Aminicenantales bacterium]|jgi:uncharacterized protein (DUF2147 family)